MEAMNKVGIFALLQKVQLTVLSQQYAQAEKSGIKADKVYEMVKIEAQKEQDEIAKYRKNRRMQTKKAAEMTGDVSSPPPSQPSKAAPGGRQTISRDLPLTPFSSRQEGVSLPVAGQAVGDSSQH